MRARRIWLGLTIGVSLSPLALTTASAQIKPASSGSLAYNEPEMRRHGSGLHRPNRLHHHHHRHHYHLHPLLR